MTPAASPLVSVIVLTHNHAPWVDQALRSLDAQTLDAFEVVIVDDASSDGTVEKIQAWRTRTSRTTHLIVNRENRGICASRNLALEVARGTFLTSLAGDDYYEADRLERQAGFFTSLDEGVAAVFAQARVVDEQGHELGIWFEHARGVPEGDIFEDLLRVNHLPATAVMTRRAAVDAVGRYDESLFYEDYDMWLRLADRYGFRYLPEVLTNYRVVASSASHHPAYAARMAESRVRILLKWAGRSVATDRIVASHAWQAALMTFAADARTGREAMQRVRSAFPSHLRTLVMSAARVPGSHALAARVFGLARRRRASRRRGPDGRLIVP